MSCKCVYKAGCNSVTSCSLARAHGHDTAIAVTWSQDLRQDLPGALLVLVKKMLAMLMPCTVLPAGLLYLATC